MGILINSKTNFCEIYSIIYELIPYMEEKYQNFWFEIINYYNLMQIEEKTNYNLIQMLSLTNIDQIIKNNTSYLNSEDDYNNLRDGLKDSIINFKSVDALILKNEFQDSKFDLILLSNILDYFHMYWGNNWTILYLDKYVNGLTNIMNDNSILYLHYAFTPYIWPRIFNGSNIKLSNLSSSYEVREVDNLNNLKQKDSIILKRMR